MQKIPEKDILSIRSLELPKSFVFEERDNGLCLGAHIEKTAVCFIVVSSSFENCDRNPVWSDSSSDNGPADQNKLFLTYS